MNFNHLCHQIKMMPMLFLKQIAKFFDSPINPLIWYSYLYSCNFYCISDNNVYTTHNDYNTHNDYYTGEQDIASVDFSSEST